MNIAKSLFLLSLSFAVPVEGGELQSGPMLGHTTAREVNIWAKASGAGSMGVRIGTKKDLSDGREIVPVVLSAESDFMATVKVDGLEAGTRYFYQMMVDGEAKGGVASFVTASGGDGGRLRFAFTSCLGEKGSESAGGWSEMAKRANSEMVFLLGDNHYANTTARAGQSAAYLDHRSVAGFRDLAARVPVYAVWDDHDFGPNDSDGTAVGKEESLATFKDFWANPAYGEEGNPGVYYRFARKGVDFFMLDSRYHRSPDKATDEGMKTMLGARQLQWLLGGLKASPAKVKIVSGGSEWQMNGHLDSWTSYARERAVILDFIRNEKITGVILLSGDRHFTGGYQLRGEVIEVTSGPLGSKNFPTENLPEMFMNHGEGKMFCVLDIDTSAEVPEIALEVFRAGEGMIDRRPLKWSQVNGDEKMTFLPVPMKLVRRDDFENGDAAWWKTDDKAWRVSAGTLSLFQQSDYKPAHRSPFNIALLKDKLVGDFEMTAKVKTTARDYGHRSMCLFFGYQDPTHFYYVHLGQETDDHANQVFIVNDAPRIKISEETTKGTPWDSEKWHEVKITRDAESGEIAVYFDDMTKPVMRATDKTFEWGQVGLGSFDDTGDWDDFELRGVEIKKRH